MTVNINGAMAEAVKEQVDGYKNKSLQNAKTKAEQEQVIRLFEAVRQAGLRLAR